VFEEYCNVEAVAGCLSVPFTVAFRHGSILLA
jgi:hypothetical protein